MAKYFGADVAIQGLVYFVCVLGVVGLTPYNMSSKGQDSEMVPALVIFGDSTVDAGNNNYLTTVVKSDFEPYGRTFEGGKATGRFTDGYIAPDYVAQYFGLPLQLPYLAPNAHGNAILTGVNFASSASGWFDNTASHFNVKGLTAQMEWYKSWKQEVLTVAGQKRGTYIISNALYIISTGANDWVNNYYLNPSLMQQYTPDTYTTFLLSQVRNYVQELYNLGGRNIGILDMPPLGCLPAQITLHGSGSGVCVKELNEVSFNFNAQLKPLLNDMKQNMHGSRVLYLDSYELIYGASTNPHLYGFSYARRGCCGTGDLETAILCNSASIGTCKDAYQYVWWDSFHPTSHLYSMIADGLLNIVKPALLTPPQP